MVVTIYTNTWTDSSVSKKSINNISSRFEKDLLDRAEEAAKSSKHVLVGVALSRDNKIIRRNDDSPSDDDEWQSDHVFDSIASDSPRRGKYTCLKNFNKNRTILEK